MNILSTFELSSTHLTFLPSPPPSPPLSKFWIFFSFLNLFVRARACVSVYISVIECLLFSSYSHWMRGTAKKLYLLILSTMIRGLFWLFFFFFFFVSPSRPIIFLHLNVSHVSECPAHGREQHLNKWLWIDHHRYSPWTILVNSSMSETPRLMQLDDDEYYYLYDAHACSSRAVRRVRMFTTSR